MSDQNFFVYGTLMTGEGNNRVSSQHNPVVCQARLKGGTVYGYERGGYPSLHLDGVGMAVGELHSFPADSPVLLSMDCLEGHTPNGKHNLYERTKVMVVTEDEREVEAWVYHRSLRDIECHYGVDPVSYNGERWSPRRES